MSRDVRRCEAACSPGRSHSVRRRRLPGDRARVRHRHRRDDRASTARDRGRARQRGWRAAILSRLDSLRRLPARRRQPGKAGGDSTFSRRGARLLPRRHSLHRLLRAERHVCGGFDLPETVMIPEMDLGARDSFIGAWYLPELDVCDELSAYFHASGDRVAGRVGGGEVDPEIKDSIDLSIDYEHFSDPPVLRYLDNLRAVCQTYVEKYQASASVDAWGITEKINIQRYAPGGGYKI